MLISGMYREDAIQIITAAIDAVKPEQFIREQIIVKGNIIQIGGAVYTVSDQQKLFVAAAGKAAAAMAQEVEKIAAPHIHKGLVITKYHHALPLACFNTIEAGHPLPDDNSVQAAAALVDLVEEAGEQDLVLLLISGGASALVTDLAPGCTLSDVSAAIQLLLNCGANIHEMNTVRKHLSQIKGGQLMRRTKAKVHAVLLSDVPGDDFSVIASGLTVPDNSYFSDAWQVLEKYRIENKIPDAVKQWIRQGLNDSRQETPKTGDKSFERVKNTLVASNSIALEAAEKKAASLGYHTHIIEHPLEGDAARQAHRFVTLLKHMHDKKACYLWGGETTVIVTGNGKGGRNQHFALSALEVLQQHDPHTSNITIIAAGTDGTDGPTDAAGAIADQEVILKAQQQHLEAGSYLARNDAFHFFEKTGALFITGPTQTNVMDIIVGLVNRP